MIPFCKKSKNLSRVTKTNNKLTIEIPLNPANFKRDTYRSNIKFSSITTNCIYV